MLCVSMVLGRVERWFPVAFLQVFLWRHHLQRQCPSSVRPSSSLVQGCGVRLYGGNSVFHHALCLHRETTCRRRGGQLEGRGSLRRMPPSQPLSLEFYLRLSEASLSGCRHKAQKGRT